MPRSRPNQNSRQQTHSIAHATVFTSPADAPAVDKRLLTSNRGQQGRGLCAVCSAEVSLRKVTYHNPSRHGDLSPGVVVIGRHRAGGGAYSPRRGDVLCQGADELPGAAVAEDD